MIAIYSSRKTPGFICTTVKNLSGTRQTRRRTRSEQEPPEQYLEQTIRRLSSRGHGVGALHNYPEVRSLEIRAVIPATLNVSSGNGKNGDKLRDMGRIQLRQYLNLLLDILNLVLSTLEVDDLDSDGLLCPLIISTDKCRSQVR